MSYGYAQLVTVLVQLIQIPFFLKYWGTNYYAEWLVLTGIPQLLSILDLGVSQASGNRAIMFAGADDRKGAVCTLQTSALFTISLCAGILAMGAGLSLVIDWSRVLGLELIDHRASTQIVMLMSGYLCSNLASLCIGSWFKAADRSALGAFLLANRRVLDVALSIVVLYFGGKAEALAGTMMVGQLAAVAVIALVANRVSPWTVFGFQSASKSEFRVILRPAAASAAIPIAQMVTLQGSVQLLNQMASPTAVVIFTMARTLMRLIIQVGITVNNALSPEISRLYGAGLHARAKAFTKKTSVSVIATALVCYSVLVVVGPALVGWWGRGRVTVGSALLALIGAHAVLNVVWYVPASLLTSTNRHTSISFIYALSSVGALLLWLAAHDLVAPLNGAAMLLVVPELAVLSIFAMSMFSIRRSALQA